MLIEKVNEYFHSILDLDLLKKVDSSQNGIQVERENPEINKIAFSVDACLETFKRAVKKNADMLFVHHGIYWGKSSPAVNNHYKRLKYLFTNNLALYAVHLPLDKHSEFGNNACISKLLDLENIEPFGLYKGEKIGYKGRLPIEKPIDSILKQIGLSKESCLGILPFGKEKISTIGVISGGATFKVEEALSEGLDLYITGDVSHSVYHTCLEGNINMISGGHYNTEIWGVKALAKKTAEDTGLETFFIDVPTGL